MVIKLDLEKEYDRLEWSFITETLLDVGLPGDLTLNCIRGQACRLLWNCEITDHIRPSRGPRQGDPISSYIFILCLERLSNWTHQQATEKRWVPVKASKSGSSITHLFFADDIHLFSEASKEQRELIQEDLQSFTHALDQKINFNKSNIFFSPNVSETEADMLSQLIEISQTNNLGKYLGFKLRHYSSNRNNLAGY